jgi:hypothetical protein
VKSVESPPAEPAEAPYHAFHAPFNLANAEHQAGPLGNGVVSSDSAEPSAQGVVSEIAAAPVATIIDPSKLPDGWMYFANGRRVDRGVSDPGASEQQPAPTNGIDWTDTDPNAF